jgi:UPF0271 protein
MSTLELTTIDLNCDLGESYGRWTLGDDEAMVQFVTSANVACGFHAGDFSVIDRTVALCKAAGVAVGAQPSYPDLQGFGRRTMLLGPEEVEQVVLYQLGALNAFCRAHQVELTHVKPHGALYNDAAIDRGVARGIARGVARFSRDLPLFGLAGSAAFREEAEAAGLRLVPEAFADRRYNADGTLQSRAIAGSLITNPDLCAQQARQIAAERVVTAVDGSTLQMSAQTICLHGDTPNAPANAAAVRSTLEANGLQVASPARRQPR